MIAVAPPLQPFALLPTSHPFTPVVEHLRARIASYLPRGGDHTVHAELRARPENDGGWCLERLYWSRQSWDSSGRLPFRADTLAYSAGAAEAAWYSFPNDPSLGNVGEAFAAMLAERPAARIDVVRYVPLRRITFRVIEGRRSVFVGKIKHGSHFREADAHLGAIARAATAARTSFRVAWPAGVNEAIGLTMQEALAGTSLVDQFTHFTARTLLYRLGAVLRELHELGGVQVPRGAAVATGEGLAHELRWITSMRPELSDLMAHLGELLSRHAPEPEARLCLCHGNFVPSQILADGGAWAVLDFDQCHLGDPYQDLAVLLASLPYDVPVLRLAPHDLLRRAEAACVSGYADRAGTSLDPDRLLWHRVRAELFYLGLAFTKDWLDQLSFERAVARLHTFVEDLAEAC